MTPAELSSDLRQNKSRAMANRRVSTALALLNIALMGAIALYQTGIIEHVPEPALPGSDADKINGSEQAYSILETPDAVLAVCSYSATLALSAMGPSDRCCAQPLVPIAFASKALADAILGIKMLVEQPKKYNAYSGLCVAAAVGTVAIAALSAPEALSALKQCGVSDDCGG